MRCAHRRERGRDHITHGGDKEMDPEVVVHTDKHSDRNMEPKLSPEKGQGGLERLNLISDSDLLAE